MTARARLATFFAGLIVLFGTSYAVAGAVVPDDVVERWNERVEPATETGMDHD